MVPKTLEKYGLWAFRLSYVIKKVLIPVMNECCVLASEIPSLFFPTSSPKTEIIIQKLNFTILVSCLWKVFSRHLLTRSLINQIRLH